MRTLVLLLVLIAFTACNDSAEQNNKQHHTNLQAIGSTDSNVQFLVAAASADFHQQNRETALRFRKTYFGQSANASGEQLFLLCGEFQQASQNEWTPFVTIRTSGYEQWIGAQATAFCNDTTITWHREQDLSAVLQSEYDGLAGIE